MKPTTSYMLSIHFSTKQLWMTINKHQRNKQERKTHKWFYCEETYASPCTKWSKMQHRISWEKRRVTLPQELINMYLPHAFNLPGYAAHPIWRCCHKPHGKVPLCAKAAESCGGGKHIFHFLFTSRTRLSLHKEPRFHASLSFTRALFTWVMCLRGDWLV